MSVGDREPPGHRPTQADVAARAGVSQTTVSQVLNRIETASITPATRRRVEAAARALGYEPNWTAKSLRSMRTQTIGFVIPDITNPFYPALEQAVQRVVDGRDHGLLIANTDGIAEAERKCLGLLRQGRVDGLIGVFFHLSARDLHPIATTGMPIVRLEARRRRGGEWPLDNLFVDNRAAARAATDHLLGRGHRSVAMITAEGGPGAERVAGYQLAMAEAGLQPMVIRASHYATTPGAHAMEEALRHAPRPTAVFAANDQLAIGALEATRDHGLRVPADVAIVGFDDIPMARYVTPRLTTVRHFQDRVGERAAEMMFERLDGSFTGPARSEEHPFELIVRESS